MGDYDQNYQIFRLQDRHQETPNPIVAAVTGADSMEIPENSNESHDMNSVWTFEEKVRLVQIDIEERERGYGFMRRVKERWESEYPIRGDITKQNLRDNASRFKKEPKIITEIESWRNGDEGRREQRNRAPVENGNESHQEEWVTEMKVRLVQLDREERSKGRGFMNRLKKRWDEEFPTHRGISTQSLRDNASRFKKDKAISNLILVRERRAEGRDDQTSQGTNNELDNANEEQLRQDGEGEEVNIQTAQGINNVEDRANEAQVRQDSEREEVVITQDEQGNHNEQNNANEVQVRLDGEREVEIEHADIRTAWVEQDFKLEDLFLQELAKLPRPSPTDIEPRERLLKVKMTAEIENSANRILETHLRNGEKVEEIVDTVYAMGKAVVTLMEVKKKEKNRRVNGGNRRERKMKNRMKELRQLIAKTCNELHRRKIRRKPSRRERKILREIKEASGYMNATDRELRSTKEKWLDELRYRKVLLDKMIKKGRRIRNNIMFQKDQRGLYKQASKKKENIGRTPEIEKFVEFWGGIWEERRSTVVQPWMTEIEEKLKNKICSVEDFNIDENKLAGVLKKRKNWTAPGADGIQNYWWKRFKSVWTPLVKTMQTWIIETNTIPEWIAVGRGVMIPKAEDLSIVKDYRPITCLNTVYKIYTGMIAKYLKSHAERNEMWDQNQMGTREGVLGTVDQLLVDNCIMDEVREQHRNLAVAYYDYQKAYDMVRHDWILKVYGWMGVPENVCRLVENLMKKWMIKLEIRVDGEKRMSRWINIRTGFLQGDSYSPVGFCLSEVPVMMMLRETKGYRMGPSGNREVVRTHSLFVDDLKVYQENHERLAIANEIIVQASHDTGACYGVKKCAEIVFERGKMVKSEGLDILEERMKALDPETSETYKFLGCEQGKKIDKEKVLERVSLEVQERMESLVQMELYDKNLVKAINCRVVPVAGYVMNVCRFSKNDLAELDMIVKRVLRKNVMHGRQASNERLYLPRNKGGRGLKSMRDVYNETKVRIACYMTYSQSEWIKVAWRRECKKEYCSIKREAEEAMLDIGESIKFGEEAVWLNGERMCGEWKEIWGKLKAMLQTKTEVMRIEQYTKKILQSEVYRGIEEKGHGWLECNMDSRKTAAVILMQEQMVETRTWKALRGMEVESEMCRLCGIQRETVHHLLSGCKVVAGNEYVRRHNNALMVLAVAWAKQEGLINKDAVWYKIQWKKGNVLEGSGMKLCWDLEYCMRKTTTARRPDLTLEDNNKKLIWFVDMACPAEINIVHKHQEKLQKYQQLAFETREKRREYKVQIVPVVIGSLGGGMVKARRQIGKVIRNEKEVEWIGNQMQKTVLIESESTLRKIISGIVQAE